MFRTLLLRSLERDWKAHLAQVAMLASSSILITFFVSLKQEFRSQLYHLFQKTGVQGYLLFEEPLQAEHVEKLRKISPQVAVLHAYSGTYEKLPVTLGVVNFSQLQEVLPYWSIVGKTPTKGDECVVGRAFSQRWKVERGQSLKVTFASGKTYTYRIVGILDSGDEGERFLLVLTPPPFGQPLFSLAYGPWDQVPHLTEQLQRAKLPTFERRSRKSLLYGMEQVVAKMELLVHLSLITVLVLVWVGIGALAASRLWQMRREIALMKALGGQRGHFWKLYLSEVALLALLGGGLGFAVGRFAFSHLSWQIFHYEVTPSWPSLGASLATCFLLSWLGCWKVLRQIEEMKASDLLKGE